MRLRTKILAAVALVVALPAACTVMLATSSTTTPGAEEVASVSTNFRWLGPNDKIIIDAFDDPKVSGVTCHVARATSGGFWYLLGMTEDPSDASLACRQVGPLNFNLAELSRVSGEKVFNQHASIWFKTVQVRRFVDVKRKTLMYIVNSDTLFSGSHKNSISTVALDVR